MTTVHDTSQKFASHPQKGFIDCSSITRNLCHNAKKLIIKFFIAFQLFSKINYAFNVCPQIPKSVTGPTKAGGHFVIWGLQDKITECILKYLRATDTSSIWLCVTGIIWWHNPGRAGCILNDEQRSSKWADIFCFIDVVHAVFKQEEKS